eukprot:990702_1
MAQILFHYPLNRLLNRIMYKNIDGSQLIKSLTMEQRDKNIRHIIAKETGWDSDEVIQILSVLFKHHTWTQSEFSRNFDRVWGKHEYNALSKHISEIKDIVLHHHNVEVIHYKIKHAQRIDEFNDCIINMVDEMIDDTKTEDVKSVYKGIAECFMFDQAAEDPTLDLQQWVCNNCGNCNMNMMIDNIRTNALRCILCGILQQDQIIHKLKNYDTYMT